MTLRRTIAAVTLVIAVSGVTACQGKSDAPAERGTTTGQSEQGQDNSKKADKGKPASYSTFQDLMAATTAAQLKAKTHRSEGTTVTTLGASSSTSTFQSWMDLSDEDSPKLRMVSMGGTGLKDYEYISIGNTTWMRTSEDAKFVKKDRDPSEEVPGLDGADALPVPGTAEASPGLDGDFKKVGEEDVEGTPTTHYSFVMAGETPMTMEYWVDAEDRTVKSLTKVANLTETTTLYQDYAVPVDIQAPDPSLIEG